MNQIKVSVIVPVYNAEHYLAECLDSALNQTLEDCEIICVDDGSTDSSGSIVKSYADRYPNVRLISQKNAGASRARNTALAAAQGKYIFFLDSDDILEPNTLESLYRKAEADQLDIVYFNAEPFFETEEIKAANDKYIQFYNRQGDYSGIHTGQSMFAAMRRNREFLGSMCLVFIRRGLILDNGLEFYNGIICEDNLFIFQCTMLARRTGYLSDRFYRRRVRGDSVMTTKTSIKNVEGYLVCYSEMLAFLRDRQVEPEAEEVISEYLYYSMFRNACTAYMQLTPEARKEKIPHGGSAVAHLQFLVEQVTKMESDRNQLKTRLENQRPFPGSRKPVLRKIRRGFKCIRDHGFVYTLKLGWKKAARILRPAMNTLRTRQKWASIQRHRGEPLVSFILPVYNVEPFLAQCLDSLLNQSMKAIEVICVDDGSKDRSLEILEAYAGKDSRVRVFTQKNQFAGAARNLGLQHARGEYVVFLDSDDFFHPDLAKEAYMAAKQKNADVVLFGAMHYNNQTGEYKEAKWLLNANLAPVKQPFSWKDCSGKLFQISTPCPWTKMFRRDFVQAKGLQFQKLQNSNDVYFTYSAMAMADRIVVVNKVLTYYRVAITTSLQATKSKNPFCFVQAYKGVYENIRAIDPDGSLMHSYVNVALSGCLHNLRSTKDMEAKRSIFDALKAHILEDLGIAGWNEHEIYNKVNGEDLRRIRTQSFEEYLEG